MEKIVLFKLREIQVKGSNEVGLLYALSYPNPNHLAYFLTQRRNRLSLFYVNKYHLA